MSTEKRDGGQKGAREVALSKDHGRKKRRKMEEEDESGWAPGDKYAGEVEGPEAAASAVAAAPSSVK